MTFNSLKKEANIIQVCVADCVGAAITSGSEPVVWSTKPLADPAATRHPLPGASGLDCDARGNVDCGTRGGARVRPPCGVAGARAAGSTRAAGPGDHHETRHPVS